MALRQLATAVAGPGAQALLGETSSLLGTRLAAAASKALSGRSWTGTHGWPGLWPPGDSAGNHMSARWASRRSDVAVQRLNRVSRSAASLRQRARAEASVVARPAGAGDDSTAVSDATSTAVVHASETPASEVQLRNLLGHSALVVTRDIEWGTVAFGFEQANRYTVLDETGTVVGLLAEEQTGFGNELGRQLLRTRRSFTATVLSPDGQQVLMRLRRPAYLIQSGMSVEDGEGNVLGEIKQRWHPIRRNYDLYIDRTQYAAISGNFLAWEFELKDADGGTLALIDRNFQGFGKELFTDAGKYVIHFGMAKADAVANAQRTATARLPASQPPITPMAQARTGVSLIPTSTGDALSVARPLALDERMIALAAAVSVDYDFFSQHSHSHGLMSPAMFMPMPVPMPMPGGGDAPPAAGDAGAAGGAAGAPAGDTAPPGSSSSDPTPPSGSDSPFPSGSAHDAPGSDDPNAGWSMGSGDEQAADDASSGWSWDEADASGSGGDEGGGLLGGLSELWDQVQDVLDE